MDSGQHQTDRPPSTKYVVHHVAAFTRVPGSLVSDYVDRSRARRLAEPGPIEAASVLLAERFNNHGFCSPFDYPCNVFDGDEPYVIGVFGGSVAHWFATQVREILAEELDATGALAGRRPVVLNFGSAGMKQPQTLLALNYFLSEGQRLDAAVVIDGFNDAALSFVNHEMGYQPSAPSIPHLQDLGASLDQFKTVDVVEARSDDETAQAIAQHWAVCSRLLHDLCRSGGIFVMQLVQPNQYHGLKPLSDAEREYAISDTTPYRRAVELIYPELRRHSALLANDGYNVIDATSAFDEVGETIYSDNCCHYNLRGNLILKDIVIDNLLLKDTPAPTRQLASPDRREALQRHSSRLVDEANSEDDFLYPLW